MTNAVILISLVFLCSYILLVVFFYIQWKRIPSYTASSLSESHPFISVIISVRNEENHVLTLLSDFEKQRLIKNFEIIFIDDHSTDNTFQIIETFCQSTILNISLFKAYEYGKKAALNLGISKSKGEIIVCTDADCRLNNQWLATISSFFTDKQAKLVFGPVTLNNDSGFSLFKEMQIIEFTSLIGSGAACWKTGFPNMCNGANIAYRKDIFYEIGGFASHLSVASGDDEFLMHAIYEKYPRDVYFIKSKETIITTSACDSIRDFYYQRLRWASKWENYINQTIQMVALYIFFINVCQIILLLYIAKAVFSGIYEAPLLALISFGIFTFRWMAEFVFLKSVLRFMDKPVNLIAFICLVLLYPFYVVFFALKGRFKKFKWKERSYK